MNLDSLRLQFDISSTVGCDRWSRRSREVRGFVSSEKGGERTELESCRSERKKR